MVDRNEIDTATRIAAGDDGTNYDTVAITLHWLTALLVLVQFALGETWGWFPGRRAISWSLRTCRSALS